MAKETLYLETSVISYYSARPSRDVIVLAHQQITWEWWEKALDWFDAYVSEIVIEEAAAGDPAAAARRLQCLKGFSHLQMNPSVERLAETYMRRLELPENSLRDAVHLALASVHEMDYLLTWNCTHIANAWVMKQLRQINESEEIAVPLICTPEELLER